MPLTAEKSKMETEKVATEITEETRTSLQWKTSYGGYSYYNGIYCENQ